MTLWRKEPGHQQPWYWPGSPEICLSTSRVKCSIIFMSCHKYSYYATLIHQDDDVIKWKHFSHCWPFAQGIHRSPVNFPHKGQWRGSLMLSLICVWTNGWVNNREAGDLRRYLAHYDVIVIEIDAIFRGMNPYVTELIKLCGDLSSIRAVVHHKILMSADWNVPWYVQNIHLNFMPLS